MSLNFQGYTILVVDDDPGIRDLLSNFLTYVGADVVTAASGDLAMEILKSRAIDAIISDIRMPVLDGQSLLKFVKKDKSNEMRPFFFITGFTDMNQQTAKNMGAAGLFNKPFNMSDLEEALGVALGIIKK